MVSVDREDEDAFREGVGDVPKDTKYLDIISYAPCPECSKKVFRVLHTFMPTMFAVLL